MGIFLETNQQHSRRAFCKRIAIGTGALISGNLGCGSFSAFLQEAQPLSAHWDRRLDHYDFVVIGSGYGGSILAARISESKVPQKSVCILERGREWPVGTFPDTSEAADRAIRTPESNPLGLFEVRASRDISVLQGCGLGGTSLINGNVAIEADADVFRNDHWPKGVTYEALRPYYKVARKMLNVGRHPRADQFLRMRAMKRRAEEMGLKTEALDLAVNFESNGLNAHGVMQKPCTDCGDCFTGCNVGAKNTLPMNYLPAARANGTHIFTHTEVDWIEKRPEGLWRVHGRRYGLLGLPQPFMLDANNVVLAAGTLGTTGILLRSRDNGLALSGRLGEGFSGNGDFLAFAHNSDHQTNVLGFGNNPWHSWRRNAPGPAVVGGIRYHADKPLSQRFIVEDLSFPKAMIKPSQGWFRILDGQDTDEGDEVVELARRLLDRTDSPYADHNAMNHTMMYLVVGHDSAEGRIRLNSAGHAEVEWGGAGQQAIFESINAELYEHARSMGARFISNPVWDIRNVKSLITAHPLGGCRMSDSHEQGVVNEFGQAYSADGSLHEGLYVADGSVIPTSLGANPLLTIAALCEKIAASLVAS